MSFGFAVECSPQNIPSCDKIQNGRHREGEAPAEPHGPRTCWGITRQEARPPNFFTPSLRWRGMFIPSWWRCRRLAPLESETSGKAEGLICEPVKAVMTGWHSDPSKAGGLSKNEVSRRFFRKSTSPPFVATRANHVPFHHATHPASAGYASLPSGAKA